MYRNRIIDNKLCFVVILIGIQIAICAPDAPEFPTPKNDYVLRSCMSSVEFDKRHIGTRKLPVALERRPGRTATSTVMQSPLLRDRIQSVDMETREKSRQKLVQQRSVMGLRLSRVMTADTPLTTLSLQRKGRNEGPQVFVRKDHLPEVQEFPSNGKRNKNEASIIVIQSA